MKYFIEAFTKKYVDFSGRARRKEFWLFVFFSIIVGIIIASIDGGQGILSTIFCLAIMLPWLALIVRRLHDIGKSGWWMLIGLVPGIGTIILLVWYCLDSQAGTNQYGPNPKAAPQ